MGIGVGSGNREVGVVMRTKGHKCYNIKCGACVGKTLCGLSGDEALTCDSRMIHRKTNADRIRAMSDEELARFLTWNTPDCANYCDDARCGCKWNCKHGDGLHVIRDWLKQPCERGE